MPMRKRAEVEALLRQVILEGTESSVLSWRSQLRNGEVMKRQK